MKLLTNKQVAEMTSLNRVTVWRMARAGKFPSPVRISQKRIGWREEDVIEYIKSLKPEPVAVGE